MKFFFSFVLCTFSFLNLYGENKVTFELPVNWTSSPKYNLEVRVPRGYRSLQPLEEWFAVNATTIEFVPKGEDGERWSEIFTINKYIGKKISAVDFVADFKKELLAKVQNGVVLKEESSNEKSYTKATFILSYDLNHRHEVIGALYYSGPYDCAGVQYTIRPSPSSTDSASLSRVEDFIKGATDLITSAE